MGQRCPDWQGDSIDTADIKSCRQTTVDRVVLSEDPTTGQPESTAVPQQGGGGDDSITLRSATTKSTTKAKK